MCEAKPGPRCSADTLKTLNKSTERVKLAYDNLFDLENRNINGELNEQITIAREIKNEAEEQLALDKAIYKATPDGIKELEKKQTEEESKPHYNKTFEEVELEVIKDHRQWQQNANKHLTGLKNEGATPEILEREGGIMRQGIIYSRDNVAEKLAKEKDLYSAIVAQYVTEEKNRDKIILIDSVNKNIHYYETYLKYANIRANDVNDFIKRQSKLSETK